MGHTLATALRLIASKARLSSLDVPIIEDAADALDAYHARRCHGLELCEAVERHRRQLIDEIGELEVAAKANQR